MIIYIDMDNVLCDYDASFHKEIKQNPGVQYPQSQYGFFERLAPVPGAITAAQALFASAKHDPYILTAPSTRNPWSYVEKRVWVERHLGYDWVPRLIICANKGLLRGDLLIDDNLEGRGQEDFTGQFFHFGSAAFPDWDSVMQRLGLESLPADA